MGYSDFKMLLLKISVTSLSNKKSKNLDSTFMQSMCRDYGRNFGETTLKMRLISQVMNGYQWYKTKLDSYKD